MEEKITKTSELVDLLKKLHDNEYAGVSGYLQGVLNSIEKEYPQTLDLIEHYIKVVAEEIEVENKYKSFDGYEH